MRFLRTTLALGLLGLAALAAAPAMAMSPIEMLLAPAPAFTIGLFALIVLAAVVVGTVTYVFGPAWLRPHLRPWPWPRRPMREAWPPDIAG